MFLKNQPSWHDVAMTERTKMDIRLVSFLPTPGQGQIGIATINFNEMVYLRFKVKAKKGTEGYYVLPASYKIDDADGKATFLPAFTIDSGFAKEKIEIIVKDAVKNYGDMPF